MDLRNRWKLLPLFEAPDVAPAAPEPAVPPVAAVDPAAVPAAEPAPDAPPAPKMVSQETMIREITPLRAKAREAEERAQRAEREAAEAKALVERLQAAKPDAAPRDPAGRFTASAPAVPAASDDTEVSRRAAELVFQRDAQRVSETGFKTYGQGWVDAVNALNAYGVNSSDFVGAVMDIDQTRAHEIMHTIAQDGEKAIALANMTPARRAAEIAKISMSMSGEPVAPAKPSTPAAPAKIVSKAPAPPPPVEPSASKVVDGYSDEASDEQFTAQFNARMKERAGLRR